MTKNTTIYANKKPSEGIRKRFFKHLPPITIFLIIFFLLLGADFVRFSERVNRFKAPTPLPQADAIIVLTGGESRLESGLFLLQQSLGKRLLISGVNRLIDEQALIRATDSNAELFSCCIDLGRQAENTIGNAEESAAWVQKNGYHSVYIVTNDYHMPRSLLHLKTAMPKVHFLAYPIKSKPLEKIKLVDSYGYLRKLSREYIKYLGAQILHILP